ncbi:hypothetical protein [Defluviitalea saccharophila]|uniref:Zinc ribbon domain-containing protein n=1 Tax=Defluviitalea saccharophila TaxID=879970 RepID=A0ABZ2Y2S0_9FIRM
MAEPDIALKQRKCQNCGATISVIEPKCPYCGGFNYEGAKRKYFRDLYRIRDKLKQLEEIPTESYKAEVSVQIKRIIKILLICAVSIAVIYGIVALFFKLIDITDGFNQADPKEQLLWDRENFPMLDEWYEAGEYDKLLEFSYELYSADKVYTYVNWQHEDFIWFYAYYRDAKDAMEKIQQKEKYSSYDITTAIYGGLNICYNLENAGLDEDEIKRLEEYKPTMETLLFDLLKFTEKEALQLYEDALEYGFLNFEKIEKYASNVIKRLD